MPKISHHKCKCISGENKDFWVESASISFNGMNILGNVMVAPGQEAVNLKPFSPVTLIFDDVEYQMVMSEQILQRSAFNYSEGFSIQDQLTRQLQQTIISPISFNVASAASNDFLSPTLIQDFILSKILANNVKILKEKINNGDNEFMFGGLLYEVLQNAKESGEGLFKSLFKHLGITDIKIENDITFGDVEGLKMAQLIMGGYGMATQTTIDGLIQLLSSLAMVELKSIGPNHLKVGTLAQFNKEAQLLIPRNKIFDVSINYSHNVPNLFITFVVPTEDVLDEGTAQLNYIFGGHILPLLSTGDEGYSISINLTSLEDQLKKIKIPELEQGAILDLEVLTYQSALLLYEYQKLKNGETSNFLNSEDEANNILSSAVQIARNRNLWRRRRILQSSQTHAINIDLTPGLEQYIGKYIAFEGTYNIMKGYLISVSHNYSATGLCTTSLTIGAAEPIEDESEIENLPRLTWKTPQLPTTEPKTVILQIQED
jgi:hypothetical protein